MFKKAIGELGYMLIANSLLFTPIIAAAEDGDSTAGAVVGFPLGAVITGMVLVSMSRTKTKATKADKYVKGELKLSDREDNYLRTETSKRKKD